jgi:hypothetical protein
VIERKLKSLNVPKLTPEPNSIGDVNKIKSFLSFIFKPLNLSDSNNIWVKRRGTNIE